MHYTSLILAFAASVMAAPTNVKRDGYWKAVCWNTELDHAGVDGSHAQLYQWAGPSPTIRSGDHNAYQSFESNGVMAYACTDDHDGSNSFSQDDVNAAYGAMDQMCPLYTAGYAIWIWNGFVQVHSGKIIGKARSTDSICQNYNGYKA